MFHLLAGKFKAKWVRDLGYVWISSGNPAVVLRHETIEPYRR
jgi:hypothetical protein